MSFSILQKQHCCICGVHLQSQCHSAGFQGALQVPGELPLSVAAVPQPQSRLPGKEGLHSSGLLFILLQSDRRQRQRASLLKGKKTSLGNRSNEGKMHCCSDRIVKDCDSKRKCLSLIYFFIIDYYFYCDLNRWKDGWING